MIRKFMEMLFRNRYLKRRLPKKFGGLFIYLSPDSQLKYLGFNIKKIANDLLTIVEYEVNKNDMIWDVGANVGLFAFSCLEPKKCNLLMIEPDPFLNGLLHKTLKINSKYVKNTNILPVVICEKVGIEKLRISKRGRASNSIVGVEESSQTGGVREVHDIASYTLDKLLDYYKKPDFIKIDVEGAELKVLKGATKILESVRPKIYIEVTEKNNFEISEIFKMYNYKLYEYDKNSIGKVEQLKCSFNTLAIPEEKVKNYVL